MQNTSNSKVSTYNYQEVYDATLAYFNGDELATSVWIDKYCISNGNTYYELTPEDMHNRLASEFYRIEKSYKPVRNGNRKKLSVYGQNRKHLTLEQISGYFKNFKYIIPQGSVMSILGNRFVVASLSNCVVIPPSVDSYGGILYSSEQFVQLAKRRCGIGMNISNLRPSLAKVSNAARTSTGAVSFLSRFSNDLREVAQNGRRGAGLIAMDIRHPDAETFAQIKNDKVTATGVNISLWLTNDFMNAVKNKETFKQQWPIEATEPTITAEVDAGKLWDVIVKSAHQYAEPGLLFFDRHHYYSTFSLYPGQKVSATNPCGEIPMSEKGDSCRLISLNMFSCVNEPFTDNAQFCYEKWYEISYEGQRINDDLVDLELESIEKIIHKIESDPEPDYIKETELRTWHQLYKAGEELRRTGLGLTGLADTLAALDVKYDSDEALDIVEYIMKIKCTAEFDCSIDLAIERGRFSIFDKKIEEQSHFIQMIKEEMPDVYKRMMKYGRRNIATSTIAPTGSLSILAQVSSGCEPVFFIESTRRRKVNPDDKNVAVDFIDDNGDKWQEYSVRHHGFQKWVDINDNSNVEDSPYYKCTAEDIDWKNRIKMQSILQKYTNHSISSTINLPEDVSIDTVKDIYMEAWESGLKGITVYRAGSRSGVIIKADKDVIDELNDTRAPKRPRDLMANVYHFVNKGDKWLGFIGHLNNRPYEMFTGRAEAFKIPGSVEKGIIRRTKENGESSYDFIYIDGYENEQVAKGLSRAFNPEFHNYARLISGVLRHGMPLPFVVNLVNSFKLTGDEFELTSWKAGVSRIIKKYIKDGTIAEDSTCPTCNDPEGLIYQEGCLICKSCGYGKCG